MKKLIDSIIKWYINLLKDKTKYIGEKLFNDTTNNFLNKVNLLNKLEQLKENKKQEKKWENNKKNYPKKLYDKLITNTINSMLEKWKQLLNRKRKREIEKLQRDKYLAEWYKESQQYINILNVLNENDEFNEAIDNAFEKAINEALKSQDIVNIGNDYINKKENIEEAKQKIYKKFNQRFSKYLAEELENSELEIDLDKLRELLHDLISDNPEQKEKLREALSTKQSANKEDASPKLLDLNSWDHQQNLKRENGDPFFINPTGFRSFWIMSLTWIPDLQDLLKSNKVKIVKTEGDDWELESFNPERTEGGNKGTIKVGFFERASIWIIDGSSNINVPIVYELFKSFVRAEGTWYHNRPSWGQFYYWNFSHKSSGWAGSTHYVHAKDSTEGSPELYTTEKVEDYAKSQVIHQIRSVKDIVTKTFNVASAQEWSYQETYMATQDVKFQKSILSDTWKTHNYLWTSTKTKRTRQQKSGWLKENANKNNRGL